MNEFARYAVKPYAELEFQFVRDRSLTQVGFWYPILMSAPV